MPRLRQVPKSETTGDVTAVYDRMFDGRDPVAQPGTATGSPGNWWTVYALAPHVLNHSQQGFMVVRESKELSHVHRELAMTRAGFLAGSKFVFSQHSKACRAVGISAEKVAALPHWSVSTLFSPDERAVLAYTDEMVLAHGRVQDGTFNELRKYLSDVAILELSYAAMTYHLHAVLSRALRLEFDDVPEFVEEVQAPEGFTSAALGGSPFRPGR